MGTVRRTGAFRRKKRFVGVIEGPFGGLSAIDDLCAVERSRVDHRSYTSVSSWESVSGSDSVVHVIGLVGILEADRTG